MIGDILIFSQLANQLLVCLQVPICNMVKYALLGTDCSKCKTDDLLTGSDSISTTWHLFYFDIFPPASDRCFLSNHILHTQKCYDEWPCKIQDKLFSM